jgi:cytochrome d ubiquinol oxidase subunit I
MWVVAAASTVSALWILLANGWMQKPRGYEVVAGRAQLVDFGALIWNPYAWIKFFHTIAAAYTLAAFFIMGISAIQMLRGKKSEVFHRSFRLGATLAVFTSILIIVAGDLSGVQVAKFQPTKLAAMESQWETETSAPFYLLQFPRPNGDGNLVQALGVPGGLSFLAYHDAGATVKGLNDFAPAERPPVMVTFVTFRLMVGLGFLFVLLALISAILAWTKNLQKAPWFLWIMSVALILPYLAVELGWILTEIGRQPWIVYGLLRTQDAMSRSISPGDVLGSLIAFIVIYCILAVVDAFLLARYARKTED